MSGEITREWSRIPGPAHVYAKRQLRELKEASAGRLAPLTDLLDRLVANGEWDPQAAAAKSPHEGMMDLARLLLGQPELRDQVRSAMRILSVGHLLQRREPVRELTPWVRYFNEVKTLSHEERVAPSPDYAFLAWLSGELGALDETRKDVRATLGRALIGAERLPIAGELLINLGHGRLAPSLTVPDVLHGLARAYRKGCPAEVFEPAIGEAERLEVSQRTILESRLSALERVLRVAAERSPRAVFEAVRETSDDIRGAGLQHTHAGRLLRNLAAAERYTGSRFLEVQQKLQGVLAASAVPPVDGSGA